MGNKIFDEVKICFDSLEDCQKNCVGWQCIYTDFCNGLSNKYICLTIDSRFLSWMLLGSFLIVLSCCLTLILCYACCFVKVRIRHPIPANYKVTFQDRISFRTSAFS